MLTLTLLLFLVPFIKQSSGINLTYIIKKENNKLEPTCLAQENERYKGVGWIYPIPERESDLPNITTKFIPNIQHDYNCDFSKNNDCNLRWRMPDWKIDDESVRSFGFIADDRWEELPTMVTSKEMKDYKVEVPRNFKLGFSVRTAKDVDILICNGWDPETYPCYKIKINPMDINLVKTDNLPKNNTKTLPYLDSYKTFSKFLSKDEWRNFLISYDDNKNGKLIVIDYNINRTAIEYNKIREDNIDPVYIIVRSSEPALWKIHHKSFLYTYQPSTYRFGPAVLTTSKDLCVSLYVSTCSNCLMTFFLQAPKSTKKLLRSVHTKEGNWELVKLKQENILDERVTIFVQTSFKDETNKSNAFWAIDSVRVCNENEVKISSINLKSIPVDQESISCQLVTQPNWRPKKLVYENIKDFDTVNTSVTDKSIYIKWVDEDPKNEISYFITYQANDICEQHPHNQERVRSKGFFITNYNEIKIDNLVPYTHYNVVISSVLHNIDKKLDISTLPDPNIRISEFPKVKIQAEKNGMYASWDKVDCAVIYGHIFYGIEVRNDVLNFSKKVLQTESTFKIDGLESLTEYKLTIRMGREHDKVDTVVFEQNFTTLPDVAPSVENLEVYAVGKNSAFLRYDLPKDTKGVPSNVKVVRCLSISKCKEFFFDVTPCAVWYGKYCIHLNNLMENQRYRLKVSMKNFNTPSYGKEVMATAFTVDRIPGAPSNITYDFVDCREGANFCNLNISWLHPFDQNSTITAFNIILKDLNAKIQTDNQGKINQIMKINNDSYLPEYTYQVKFIPYGAKYEVSIQSLNNNLKSSFAKLNITTDDLGTHLNQTIKALGSDDGSVTFSLAPFDPRLDYYILSVYVQDFNKKIQPNMKRLGPKAEDNLCHAYGDTWLAKEIQVTNQGPNQIQIGHENEEDKNNSHTFNRKLTPDTKYCFTFIITNHYRNTDHEMIYYETATTTKVPTMPKAASSSQNNHLYALLLFLLVVPIAFAVYWYIRKRKARPKQAPETPDNIYESLPFDECEENSVNNFTYDKLLHK